MQIIERAKHLVKAVRKRAVLAPLLFTVTVLILSHFITSKNLFIINDGDSYTLVNTYAKDTESVLAEAGIYVRQSDLVSLPAAQLSGGYAEVTIDNKHTVTVTAGNRIVQVNTKGETVAELLARTGIEVSDNDLVVPSLSSYSYPGMSVSVVRISYVTESVYEEIPYTSRQVENAKLEKGKENLLQEGKNGLKRYDYSVSLKNDIESSRQLAEEVIEIEPVEEIIEYGTYVAPTPAPTPKPTATVKYKQGAGVIDDKAGTITTPDGQVLSYSKIIECQATAYTTEGYKNKKTAIGTIARVGAIAVDPKVIPLGSKVYVISPTGSWVYGVAVCEDVGGAVKGNIVDLFFNTRAECFAFGRRKCLVYVLN